MNNKITFLVLLTTLSLSACQKSNDPRENLPKTENKNISISTAESQNNVIDTKIDCGNATLNQWYGFNEHKLEDAKCVQLENLNFKQVKCEKEPNAFGADFDGIRFESENTRIFAYSSKELCENAKGIWEANAY